MIWNQQSWFSSLFFFVAESNRYRLHIYFPDPNKMHFSFLFLFFPSWLRWSFLSFSFVCVLFSVCLTYPGFPLLSILFANSTSFEYMSNCHWRCPKTPASIAPVWIPTRMSTELLVFSRTYLIAFTIERPIWTQRIAWSSRSSGATQVWIRKTAKKII